MQKRVPAIHESADELKQRLKDARDPARKQRLHALYLLASGQARFRTDVADLLGMDRRTMGRWLDLYEQRGLDALLAIYVPTGKKPPLSSAQLAQLQQALERPEGFASYYEIQQWIARELGVELGYHSVHTIVHDKLGARPKVPRLSHQKNAAAVATFKQECASRIQAAIPAGNQRPIKLWAGDESRFGLHTVRRRRITACGTKPIGIHQNAFKNF